MGDQSEWIDLNCDMGESYGIYHFGNDELIMPHITSCNVACGFHAGDPVQILRTLKNAQINNLRIGAHPGYEDRVGFGRRMVQMSAEELGASIKYQVSAVQGMAASIGAIIRYVKPHGALYNAMCKDSDVAEIVVSAIKELRSDLAIMGMAGSLVRDVVNQSGMTFISEAFIDRKYTGEGQLLSRLVEGAVIEDVQAARAQYVSIASKHRVSTVVGTAIPIEADTICIHGDNPNAVAILKSISELRRYGS